MSTSFSTERWKVAHVVVYFTLLVILSHYVALHNIVNHPDHRVLCEYQLDIIGCANNIHRWCGFSYIHRIRSIDLENYLKKPTNKPTYRTCGTFSELSFYFISHHICFTLVKLTVWSFKHNLIGLCL